MRFFDRRGVPISRERWSELSELPEYNRVAFDTVGDIAIQTTWVGADLSYSPQPEIFKTAVIRRSQGYLQVFRSSTLLEALKRHETTLVAARRLQARRERPWLERAAGPEEDTMGWCLTCNQRLPRDAKSCPTCSDNLVR